MKKRVILSLAAGVVFAANSAFAAANPFADVPAKHWAYDAVTKLQQAGIVDGYDNKTFGGEKTMTRYEMAQVVGKALNKADKANADSKKLIDKLSTEFAAELNNLGVRVSNLEAKQSNLKFTGDARVRWNNTENAANAQQWKDRFRLNMTSQINENTSMYARFVFVDDKFNQDNAQKLTDLAFTTKFNKTNVTLGRYSLKLGPTGYLSDTTGKIDGIQTNSTFGDFGVKLGYAQADTSLAVNKLNIKNIAFAEGTYTTGKAKFYADYFKNLNVGAADGTTTTTTTANLTTGALTNTTVNNTVKDAYKIAGVGATYTFSSNVKVTGEFYKNSANGVKLADGTAPKAYMARVDYKGVSAAKPGSWGTTFEYAHITGNALPFGFFGPMYLANPTSFGISDANLGVKYYDIVTSYAVAKNVTIDAIYQFNVKTAGGVDAPSKSFTRAQINYFF